MSGDRAELVGEFTTVKRVTLSAAVIWFLLHVVQAIAFSGEHREPWVLSGALLLAAAVNLAAVAPLFTAEPRRPSRVQAVALALLAGLVCVGVAPFLTVPGLLGYANWPVSGMNVLVAALVIRRRAGAAALAVAAMAAANTTTLALRLGDPELVVGDAMVLVASPLAWLACTAALRVVLDRSVAITERYRRRHLDAVADAMVAAALQEVEAHRRAEVRAEVLPLLHRIAEGDGPVDEATRAESARVAASLRDDLQARGLLDAQLRAQVREARQRGVRVTLSSDLDRSSGESDLQHDTRTVLAPMLAHAPSGSRITARVTIAAGSAVLVVSDVHDPRALTSLHRALTRVGDHTRCSVSPDAYGDEVVVNLDARAAPGLLA